MEQMPFSTEAERFAENPEPRVACVLLLDVSGSMAEVIGNPGQDLGYTVQSDGQTYRAVSGGVTKIDELNAGLVTLKDVLAADTLAAKRAEVAVVTFGSEVRKVSDFTTIEAFQPPALSASGPTPMGEAIRQAVAMLQERKEAYRTNGISYFRPWIFLITDGGPTDEWRSAADLVKQGETAGKFSFFGIGVEGANMDVLKQICVRTPLRLKGLQFRDMFVWLSKSMSSVSRSKPGDAVQLTNPTGPEGWATV